MSMNVLLLGETGVGKTTFINSIANYLKHKSFGDASDEGISILASTLTSVTDQAGEIRSIEITASLQKHSQEVGAAGTTTVTSYNLPLEDGKLRLNLIDTPGLGDPRGVEQDTKNLDIILRYLTQLDSLHGVCLLMKPESSRTNYFFEYCIRQLLSRLEKSASRNLLFVYTKTRSSFYVAGDTLPSLKRIVVDIKSKPPHVDIPFGKDNIFCLDNEGFKYLAAKNYGVVLNHKIKEVSEESWNISSKQCRRLISYVTRLQPHELKKTIELNTVRLLIDQFVESMFEVIQLIGNNIRSMKASSLMIRNADPEELKKELYVPIFHLKVEKLTKPVMVCINQKCSLKKTAGDQYTWTKRTCQEESSWIKKLIKIYSNGAKCNVCECHINDHERSDTTFSHTSDSLSIPDVKESPDKRAVLQHTEKSIEELQIEYNELIVSVAKFSVFLQNNSLSPLIDKFRQHVQHLVACEESAKDRCQERISSLKDALKRYEDARQSIKSSKQEIIIQDIRDVVKGLRQLKHNGSCFAQLFEFINVN